MKKIQDLWDGSSTQVVEAEEQVKSRKEKIKELRRCQSELEQELSELEVTINETQRTRASQLRQGIKEVASLFSERSVFYASIYGGDLFSAKSIEEDEATISTYESAKVEKIKALLQREYEQALQNQAERQKAKSLEPIDVGVVLHEKGEQKLDVYLTVLTTSNGRIANNLTQAVHKAVKASGVSFAENNVEDLLRITIEGNYQGLVQDLGKIKPEGFKEANIEYQVVVLGETARKIERQKEEKRSRTALQMEEAIPVDELPKDYRAIDDVAAALGIHRTYCYQFLKFGELVSKKYRLPDRAKVVRAVEVGSLRALCQKRGRAFPDLSGTVTASVGTATSSVSSIEEPSLEPVLENMVSASPTTDVEANKLPQPELSLAQSILGEEKFTQYARLYSAQKVEEVVKLISTELSEERARILFEADKKFSLFKGGQGLHQYVGRCNVLLYNIDSKYGSDVPSEFSFEDNPSDFLPANLSAMEQKLEKASIKPKPLPSEEMLKKIGIGSEMARKLMGEGYHPIYVFAMLTEGFDLGKDRPLIGERYIPRRHWMHNYRRSLDSLGVSNVDEKAISYHERKFNSLGLFYVKSKEERPLAFNPDWAKRTSGALRDYLSSVFPKR